MAATTPKVTAVIFDMDGTLLDTEKVTRDIVNEFLASYGKVADAQKEERRLGQMYKDSVTGIIADYGLPITVEEYGEAIYPLYIRRWKNAKPLPGVKRLVKHLHKNGVPLAIATNSVSRNVGHKLLMLEDWRDCFSAVLCVDHVPHGKPAPDIFLEAAKRLNANPSSCLVIEDSLVGVQGAKASGAMVVAVPSLQSQRQHYSADSILYSLLDFHPELWSLPPFEDYIQGALPIEPLSSNAKIGDAISNNLHMVTTGDCTHEYIPDQISGIFFGWAKLEAQGVCKVVVSIGWNLSLQTTERVMHIHFLDACCNVKTEEAVELLLTGYIRKLPSTENVTQALTITVEDQGIARDALDLPAFSEYATSRNGLALC